MTTRAERNDQPWTTLDQIVSKARSAKAGHIGVLSTGEKLAAALVLNRADWLAEMDYTMSEAVERIGPEWMAQIPAAIELLKQDAT